jgi:alcohol dehydrogenase (cytochrome c)
MRSWWRIVGCAAAMSFAPLGGVALAQAPPDAILPAGPAKAWVAGTCTHCHDLTPIVASGYSKDGWAEVVRRMIGAAAPAADVQAAAEYLAKAYPAGRGDRHRRAEEENRTVENYRPVTAAMLRNPDPADWLMYSRTYDAQRFSPLHQIDASNVGELALAWSRGLPAGTLESIPLVHDGTIYTIEPGAGVIALDGTTGDFIWEYRRNVGIIAAGARAKTLAIFGDILAYTAPDGYIVGLDAKTGAVRWETYVGRGSHTSGAFMVEGKIISGRSCQLAEDCFIAAHDALTGKELWRFHQVPAPQDPAAKTWGDADMSKVTTSTWGLPGSYDPARRTLYWGTANPGPYMRIERNRGGAAATSMTAPSALYSNSTLALDPDTGTLKWYYQHLPGDDFDTDYTHERTLVTSVFEPDPAAVKWINPLVPRGERRDMAIMVGEGGGIFALDRGTGQFLWAAPFPYDVPNFVIKDIDVRTGATRINFDLVHKKMGDRSTLCFFNTRSFWPTAYSPQTHSLYVPYVDNCVDMTAGGKRFGVPRAGSDPNRFAGIAKIDVATGRVMRFAEQREPDNGAMLATAGNLVFHGDLNRRFRAYDATTGKQLWQTILPGPVEVSTITYAAKGRQYVLVMTGDGQLAGQLAAEVDLPTVTGHSGIYAFALPDGETN